MYTSLIVIDMAYGVHGVASCSFKLNLSSPDYYCQIFHMVTLQYPRPVSTGKTNYMSCMQHEGMAVTYASGGLNFKSTAYF